MIQDRTITVAADTVADGSTRVVEVDAALSIALFRVEGEVFAIDDRCPHAGGSLAHGAIEGSIVVCPLHGFRVDVRTGQSPDRSYLRVASFAVEQRDGMLTIRIPAGR